MTAGFVLAWTAADGSRHANPIARNDFVINHVADNLNRTEQGGNVYVRLPVEDMETWKTGSAMDVSTQAWADAQDMMINPAGDPVPANMVPGRMKLEDQTVRILIDKALAMQAAMAQFKAGAFSDFNTFMAELAASYGVSRGGRRGGGQLNSYDGLKRVEISVADQMVFGPELESAKTLIDECIASWASDAGPELRTLVNSAFRVGGTGKVRVDRVLELRQLEIDDQRWKRAMVAISDALRRQGSVSYIRFYQRASQDDAWQHIPLDMSRL